MAEEKKVPIEDRAVQRIMWKVDAEFKATGNVSKLDVVDRECLSKESNSGAPLLARLQAADELAVYATHKPSCPKLTMERGHNCDCGYTEALAKFEKLREAK